MKLSVNTNHAAVSASAHLAKNNALLMKSMARLASGKRIVDTSDDAGGLAVALKLKSSIEKLNGVKTNVDNALSFLDVQDGILQSAALIVDRMAELKALSQDVLKNSSDINGYNTEFKSLQVQLYQMSKEKFNGVSLFAVTTLKDGGSNAVFEKNTTGLLDNTMTIFTSDSGASGPQVSINKTVLLSALTFDSSSVSINKYWGAASSKTFAATSIDQAKNLDHFSTSFFSMAVENLASLRAENGSSTSRLEFALDNAQRSIVNLEASYGQIMDVDIAEESTNLAKYQILVQASTAMLQQANSSPNIALMLLS